MSETELIKLNKELEEYKKSLENDQKNDIILYMIAETETNLFGITKNFIHIMNALDFYNKAIEYTTNTNNKIIYLADRAKLYYATGQKQLFYNDMNEISKLPEIPGIYGIFIKNTIRDIKLSAQ